MRAFVAAELPPAFADDVAGLARRLREVVPGRFVPRENYHVTLAFLGDVDEVRTRGAMSALEAVRACGEPVGLRAEGLGTFGRGRDVTLWLGLACDPGLTSLAKRVRGELAARGISYDERPFMPHVTLARRARLPRGPMPDLAFPLPGEACDLTLFRSYLEPDGARYKPLYSVRLGA